MQGTVYFPLPPAIHVGFVIVSTIILILLYIKQRHRYQLFLLIGICSTLLVYVVAKQKWAFYVLGIEEIALFVLTVIGMHKREKADDEKLKKRTEEINRIIDEKENIDIEDLLKVRDTIEELVIDDKKTIGRIDELDAYIAEKMEDAAKNQSSNA